MARVLRLYHRSYTTSPNLTLAITASIIGGTADAIAQSLDTSAPWDPIRTGRFMLFNSIVGPLTGKWNGFLERSYPIFGKGDKVRWAQLLKRVGLDQFFMAPFGLCVFLTAFSLMESGTMFGKFSEMFIPALLANYKVWPAVQVINFRFVPLAFRVLFSSCIGVLWTIYLSLLNSGNSGAISEKAAKSVQEAVHSVI